MARMVSRITRSLILFCGTLIFAYPYHPRAERLGAATQKVKPRRVAASEAEAERVSNPRLSAKYFAKPWWASSRISALADRNISAGAKNRRAGQMSQPGKENYENTNLINAHRLRALPSSRSVRARLRPSLSIGVLSASPLARPHDSHSQTSAKHAASS